MQRTRQGRRRRDRVLACMRSDVSGTPDRAAWRRLITGRSRLPGEWIHNVRHRFGPTVGIKLGEPPD
jgi:hypothetical protein